MDIIDDCRVQSILTRFARCCGPDRCDVPATGELSAAVSAACADQGWVPGDSRYVSAARNAASLATATVEAALITSVINHEFELAFDRARFQ